MPKAKPDQVVVHRIELQEKEREMLEAVAMAHATRNLVVPAALSVGVGVAGYVGYKAAKAAYGWTEDIVDDMKEIVRLLVFNLLHQIETGRLHADVHPGNIRIMPDDRVALLDRNFYLDLDDADRQLVQDVMQGGPYGLIDAFGRYLAAQPENASIHGMGEILRQGWQGAPDGLDPAKKVVRVLASARTARVHIPLRVTLFVKNVLALDHLARKAGYANLLAVLVS